MDNDYGTWTAWGNQYWPAKYFVDRRGHVRYAHFGEGAYEESEDVIRKLLAEPGLPPPVSKLVEDTSPNGPQTPETYLGYARLTNYVGSPIRPHTARRVRDSRRPPGARRRLRRLLDDRRGADRRGQGRAARARLRGQGRPPRPRHGAARRGRCEVTLDGEPLDPCA